MRALAAQVGTSHSSLHRWFSGAGVPAFEDVVAIVTALGVVGDEKEAILEMARDPRPNWVATGPPGVSRQLAGVMELERTAKTMVQWSPLAVPGLLQTREYARAVIDAAPPSPGELDAEHLVTLRLGRQNAILREDPIQFLALIGELGITDSVGDDAVMAGQLRYLLRASEFEAVTIRMVPVGQGWHDGRIGPFVLYAFPGHPSIVHLEHHRSGTFLDDQPDVESYRTLADTLENLAMSEAASREMISRELAKREAT